MQIESLPDQMVDVVQNNNGLKLYLNSLLKGRKATPPSWLYEDKSWTEVMSDWLDNYLRPNLDVKDPILKKVFQHELSQLKKAGPQGEVKPVKELMDLVAEGYELANSPKPVLFTEKLWHEAKEMAVKLLFKDTGIYKRLRRRAHDQVVDDMRDRDTLESNSGWRDFSRRKLPTVLQHAYEDIAIGRYLEHPAILLFRNYNNKTRPVWMYPMSTNIVEGSFTQPLKEMLMKHTSLRFFSPWRGYEEVSLDLTEAYNDGYVISASDFSHTDAHFTKWAMLEVYDVIKFAFQESEWKDLKQSMLHVVDIPLVVGPDKWIIGAHGVSSGSNWTNDVETYMDFIIACYLKLKGLVTDPFSAIGDDMAHKQSSFNKNFAKQVSQICIRGGFDVNAEKVTNDLDDVKYLQRYTFRGWVSKYRTLNGTPLLRGVYSTIRALNSSLNPEKFHSPKLWSKDMFAVRQFMILENCIDHPLFEDFVIFVCKGHSYLGEFAASRNTKIDESWRKSRLIPGLNPTYNQEKRDKPMSSFESIRIARDWYQSRA